MKLRRMLSMILVVALVVMSMPSTPFVVRAAAADITLTIADDGTVSGGPDGNVLSESFTYDGTAKEPTVEVTGQVVDEDYEVQYDNNTAAGEGKVTISSLRAEGAVGYFEAVEIIFEINPADLSGAVVTVSDETFNGSEIKAVPSVVLNGVTLSQEEDYEVSYEENADYTNAGTGKKVTVTGKGNYTGSADGTYAITALSLTGANVQLTPSSDVWSESVANPSVTVKLNSETVNSSWYQVVYPDSYHLGDNTIKVKPKNSNLTGEASATLTLTVDTSIDANAITWEKNPDYEEGNTFYFKSVADVKINPQTGYEITGVTGSGAILNQGAVTVSSAVTGLVLTMQKVENGNVLGQNDVSIGNIVFDGDAPVISNVETTYTSGVIDGWVKGIEKTVVTASDAGAGLNKVYYYTAENENNPAEASFGAEGTVQLTLEADKTYTIYATDKLGNKSAITTETIYKVDGDSPEIWISDLDDDEEGIGRYPADANKGYTSGAKTFYVMLLDEESGVDVTQSFSGNIVCMGTTAGATVYTITAVDKVGNSATREFTVICDPDAPVITDVKLNDTTDTSIYTKEDVVVSAKITDDDILIDASEENQLKTCELHIQTGENSYEKVADMVKGENDIYSCTVPVTDQYVNGTYKIVATDNAKNKSESALLSIEIDQKAPEKPVIVSPSGDNWINSETVAFNINVTHDHGGNSVHKVVLKYSTDGTNWTDAAEGTVSGDVISYSVDVTEKVVDTTYYFKAVDAAGNESEVKNFSLKKDSEAPDGEQIYVSYESDNGETIEKKSFTDTVRSIFAKKKIMVSLYLHDEGSGVAEVSYVYGDNGSAKTVTVPEGDAPTITIPEVNNDEIKFTEVKIELTIPENSDVDEIAEKLTITKLVDHAGNVTEGSAIGSKTSGNLLIIDSVKPKLTVNYPKNEIPEENSAYYAKGTSGNSAEKIVFTFTEKYFKENFEKDENGEMTNTVKKPEFEFTQKIVGEGEVATYEGAVQWGEFDSATSTIKATVSLPYMDNKEVEYTVKVKYADRAGNPLEYGSINEDGFATFDNTSGAYQSGTFVLDDKAPELKLSLVDASGNVVDPSSITYAGREYYTKALKLKVEVVETYANLDEFKDSISSNSVVKDSSEQEVITAQAFAATITESVGADGIDCIWEIPMSTEANYDIYVDYKDPAGNKAKITDVGSQSSAVGAVTKKYCYDETAPVADDLEVSIEKAGGLFAAIKYGDIKYLFAKNNLKVRVDATDAIAGLQTITVSYTDKDSNTTKELQGKIFTAPKDKAEYVFETPIAANFRGFVSAKVTDWCENETEAKDAACVVENAEKHKASSSAKIKIETSSKRGNSYYNSDVKGSIEFYDKYSGIREYEYSYDGDKTTKNYASQHEYKEDAGSVSFTVEKGKHNKNDIKIESKLVDNCGHESKDSKTIHIDATAPIITVTYDLDTPANGKYYNAVRTATVTIKERNFDENDVEWNITNTMGSIPGHSGWTTVGSGDDAKHICTVAFREDGDYTFGLKFQDLAGNWATDYEAEPFTIDRTIPQYTVTYDNNNVQNGHYYNAGRTATIDVTEHNFDASLVNIVCNATKGGVQPVISGWRRNGDHNIATVQFSKDGDYTFDITGMDLANNAFADYAGDHFVIDTVAPKVEIFDIENMSANNGIVRPGVKGSDINYDASATQISMKGYYNGLIDMTSNGTVTRSATGVEIKLNDFEHKKNVDDLYTMNAVVYDLAGNRSEASVIFSVNRFGSVYTFDEKTEELLGINGKFYTNAEREIVVVETNVDTLEFKEITCNANGTLRTLKEGEDYTVNVSGSDVSWKQYTYTIAKENFSEEGDYLLTIYSEDRAKNVSDNNSKGKKLEFIVDKTSPSIVVAGVENDGQYRENSREVILDVQDNVLVSSLVVKLNGKETVYTMADISEVNGRIVFLVDSANTWQTMSITAYDAAGNAKEFDEIRFLVTSNIFIQFIMNTPLVIGTVVALMALAGGFWFIAWKRRKKEN